MDVNKANEREVRRTWRMRGEGGFLIIGCNSL
jgi:hypothetical protein